MRIALLFHEKDRDKRLERYYITHLSRHWMDDGHDVVFVFGPAAYVPADVAVVHVNLSIVPEPYLELARRYRVAVNGRVADIRKSTISANLVGRDDGYDGPVIVKSNFNYAGQPERDFAGGLARTGIGRRLARLRARVTGRFEPGAQSEYRVYESPTQVPAAHRRDRRLVVERFRPERDGRFYVVHTLHFLGDRLSGARLWSCNPIVTQQNLVGAEREDPHPEVVRWRDEMGFDYGKFDYVVHGDEVTLLDANKTTGAEDTTDPAKLERRRFMAQGLYWYCR